ncbi:MAG: hypothetical protein A2857_01375 [Candidatus Levybacteria bacterium RIFCSPHIGHO2_01_FULL_36_15]|nr:MAG: hypothetical protein A2857_01375 [Candidatus Levybacteria bacterium RIFCSPHIGHO2_01_FULL_36_15]OGH38043.1 MAG: hypothetical protein A2905_05065 [Candidatus Levybacteria bacterium RIFCSPLOWO2_01_FULL_36_10]
MNKKFSIKVFQLVSVVIASVLLGFYFGTNKIQYEWKNFIPIVRIESKNPPPNQSLDMALFFRILDKLNTDYYDKTKIDSQKVLHGAISGMLQSLGDPYTSFFPPKENTSFKSQLSGEFHGIGAELGMSPDNKIMVISPLDDSPAQKAGIKSGDIILKVDEKDTNGWTLSQAVDKIRGPKGTDVALSILHQNSKNPVNLKITRDVIVVKSVAGWVKNVSCSGSLCKTVDNVSSPSVAYIRLSQFGDKTNDEWIALVNQLYGKINNSSNFKGIILDLRNNPGGYLNDAVFIASEFLKDGAVVLQQDNTSQIKSMEVSRKGLLTDYPLIVLVNKGSASASEIVAGALHDHKRGRLVGEKTFGKGTVQEAVELGNGASVHVSVAKWLTPNGTWVNQEGLDPDISVTLDTSDEAKKNELDNQLQRAIQELISK